jgi:hypothetical protein
MTYKDNEILARVWQSSSDLYTLKRNGELNESLDIVIDNHDQTIVWYEVEGMEHLNCSRGYFTEIPTIEEAKLRIDAYDRENKE